MDNIINIVRQLKRMHFIKKIERYQKIDNLIQQQNTGTPEEFAQKLNINRSHLYRLLDKLKDYGALIKYYRKTQTFYYDTSFYLTDIFPISMLPNNKMETIKGGGNIFFASVSFYETECFYFSMCNYISF